MKALYTRYNEFLSDREKQLLARIIRDARPRAEWESWLPEE
jgi:hypothetical protein